MFNADYENYFESEIIKKTERNQVEASLNLSEENEQKILCLSGRVYDSTDEVEDKAVIYGGLATFNVVFGGDELMRIEVGTKFSFKTEQIEGTAFKSVSYSLDNVKVKKEGGMLYVTAYLTATLSFIKVEEKKFLTEVNALKKMGTLPAFTPLGTTRNFTVEDEFEAKKIKRVLFSDANAYITSVTAGADAVTVDGVANICVLALPFSENGDILKEVRRVPFSFEADLSGADQKTLATATVCVDKLSLKVFAFDEENRSRVEINAVLTVTVTAANRIEKAIVEDCYSPTNKLSLTPVTLSSRVSCGNKSIIAHFSDKANCIVPEYSRLTKTIGERVETASVVVENGEIKIEGVVIGNALFADGEEHMTSQKFDLPFSVRQRVGETKVDNVGVCLDLFNCKLKNGRLEAEADLAVCYEEICRVEVEAISGVEEGEEKPANTSAVSVYISEKGDDKWEITKKLGVDWSEIEKFNKDLTFPLSGGEKIIVFRGR